MSQQLQTYEPIPLDGALAASEPPPPQAAPAGLGWIWAALRRRWKMVLILWVLVAVPSVPCVILLVKPTYTASATVQVAPILSRILYEDEENKQAMPLFDTYLNTQAQRMASLDVLTAALADPSVQTLPLLKEADPMAELRKQITVGPIPKTHLVLLSIKADNPNAAVRLTKAVLEAYMTRVTGSESDSERKTREVLNKDREELRARLDRLNADRSELAKKYGTSSDAMFELLRKSHEESSFDSKQKLDQADLDILQMEWELKQLEAGVAGVLKDDAFAQREQAVATDPVVRSLNAELEATSARLARLRSTLMEDHKEVVAARNNLERLQGELEKARTRASADADKEIDRKRQDRIKDTKVRLKEQIDVAKRNRDALQERVKAREAKGVEIGRQGLAIQDLREQIERTKQDYDRVLERLRQLEIEGRRETRITKNSDPEVLPDGLKDRRLPLALAAFFGAFFFASAVACLRDRLDPHLRDTEHVETRLGLPMLGAVPSLADMQSGRITKEEFVESYRLIRATLAGITLGGTSPKSLLVTSAQAGEGKTSLAVSLALALAEPGDRVLLVDGDIQGPQIARLLNLSPPHDLENVLAGERSLAECVVKSVVSGLDVLVARRNGRLVRDSLNTRSAGAVVQQAAGYDHVVIDSPPTLGAADALVWAHAADGVIVSSLVGQSDTVAIHLACDRLKTVGARLLGVVVANVSRKESYYSYSSASVRQDGTAASGNTDGVRREPPVVCLPEKPGPSDPAAS